jgi:hypothetical protein
MRRVIVLLFLLALTQLAQAISADLGQIGVGARPLGMGLAYVGYAQDGSAIFLNPAGLSLSPTVKFTSMAGKLLEDISYVSIGYASPTKYGDLGIAYINASTTGIPLTTLTTYPTGTFEVTQYDVTDYSSSVLYLAYAREVLSGLSLGGNFKLFSQGFSKDTGSMEGSSGVGMDLDLSAEWKLRKEVTLGLMLQNIVPASLGGKFIWKRGNVQEGIPALIKLGSAFKLIGEEGFGRIRDNEIILTLDSEISPTLPRPTLWHVGGEWWPYAFLAIRGGIDQKAKATESGVGIDGNLTTGVGLKYKGFCFDYAYHQYGELTENASHFFSIGYQGVEEKPEAQKLEEKKKEMEKEGLYLKLKEKPEGLKTFVDVPQGYWAKDPIEYLATLNIISGFPDSTFRPEEPLTRAELAALLVKAKGFPTEEPKEAIFVDVPTDHWAAKFIKVALQRKYVSGYPDGKFRPWQKLTRAEGVAVIDKFAGLMEPLSLDYNPFPDVSKRHWAARSIAVAKAEGLLEYLSGKNFEPEKSLSRAEAAEIISKTAFAKEKIKELLKK